MQQVYFQLFRILLYLIVLSGELVGSFFGAGQGEIIYFVRKIDQSFSKKVNFYRAIDCAEFRRFFLAKTNCS